ncbi:MAG: ABC transporter permease [Bacteriovorax sp.]|nr:ABC transporter permease [Bacteriovorax sp.]
MIKLQNVTRKYLMGDEEIYAIKDLNLEIEEGDYVAIMGPSGSGKSSLMNILGLLDLADSGEYFIDDVNTRLLDDEQVSLLRRNKIGFIFQQFNLLSKLTARENIELPKFYSKLETNENIASELLHKVGLSSRENHFPHELSGGQQQRVAIARSLVNSPLVILADEPTGNLDSQSEKDILEILEDLNKQGITIIVVTHEDEVGERASRVIKMRDGVIQQDIRQKPIYSHSKESAKPIKKFFPSTKILMLREYFQQGLRNLFINKMRSVLSILGILIGVSSVIAMMAFGRGAEESIKSQLTSLGSNLLIIRPEELRGVNFSNKKSESSSFRNGEIGGRVTIKEDASSPNLSLEDTYIIKEQIQNVKNTSGLVEGKVQTSYQNKNKTTSLVGTSPEYAEMHSLTPEWGRFFSKNENDIRERVAVIGDRIVKDFFPEINPVGEFIKINKLSFRVIGILPKKGNMGQTDLDDRVIIPVLTAQYRVLGINYLNAIEVELDKLEHIKNAQNDVLNLLYQRHQIGLSQRSNAYKLQNMADVQKALSSSSKTMSMLLMSIATISLLVGGIGIMNIMLVSVTERTKEIGIRKSIGAMNKDILLQFLIETIVISSFGGILGIITGILIAILLKVVLKQNIVVGMDSILLSFAFSSFIGLFFGILPAKKASELRPIEALRASI